MKKSVLYMVMAVVICMMTVLCVCAATNVTDGCPCSSYTYVCGGSVLQGDVRNCDNGCKVSMTEHKTFAICNNCGKTVYVGTHLHISHSKCDNPGQPCPYGSAIASIDNNVDG